MVVDIHMTEPCLEDRDFGGDKTYGLMVVALDAYSAVVKSYREFFEQSANVDGFLCGLRESEKFCFGR